ncbi:ubiquitin-associated protein 1-like isoform X2 [Xenia sp. Carnegie-2017]|uniref:ubiquitin-associated protein 1-like isoform X2 n=1 Tax=Xenia sp. Carnegie-2017 TaxID=2897299 RepID=UPI001F040561|nr:ubiquitin-associated protein 1-like isoform X2 [Xenia sp. Carnegie-2017]
MQRSTSVYGSSVALNGVQMKIGEKFKAIAQYDFALEQEVIKKYNAEKEARQQHEQAEKAKTLNPFIANIGNEILQPISTSSTPVATSVNGKTSEQFNYKDFEDNTDTPFESVERQSINDMDALRSILQPKAEGNFKMNVSNNAGGIAESSQGVDGVDGNTDTSSHKSNMLNTVGNGKATIHQSSNLNETRSASPMNANSTGENTSMNGDQFPPQHSQLNAEGNRRISLPGALRVFPPGAVNPPPRHRVSDPNKSVPMETESAFQSRTEEAITSQSGKKPVPKPRSKFPPIVNSQDTLATSEPIYDVPPPPLPPKKNIGKSKQANNMIFHDAPFRLPPISPPNHVATPHINDPRSSLSVEERKFVDQISGIGFDVGQVARAVKHLGCKQQEVIEYVILVNDLCNDGEFSSSQVEMVLKENTDKNKAKEFLKLIVKFKELGFEENKVFEALKKSECDDNKTLDILTNAS